MGGRLLEKLDEDGTVCECCYSRIRRSHDEFVEDLEGDATVGDYGDVLKITATSTPEPATFSETVPPTSLPCDPSEDPHGRDRRWQPARGRTICQCGQIDRPETTGPRSAEQRAEAIQNVADRCREDDRPFDVDAAHAVLSSARERPSLGGRHRDVFEMAVGFGLSKG